MIKPDPESLEDLYQNYQASCYLIGQFQQENEALQKRVEQYKTAYELLNHQLQELRRYRFGKKSEKMVDVDNPQLSLFDNETEPAPTQTIELNDSMVVSEHTRKKKGKKDLSKLPREIRIISVNPEELYCGCGETKRVIRYEVKEMFHYKPSEFSIVEERREVVACPKNCCERAIQTAQAPKHILPKVKATEELLAATVVNKLHHRQPLYHLEKYTTLSGITRETMARWQINLAPPLVPLYNLMQDEVIDYDVASIDATTLQVLKEPGRAPETKSYLYCIRGGPPERAVVLYAYNAEKHKEFVDSWLNGFCGSIHMDADPFFGLLLEDNAVHAANCNAHARRHFEAIVTQTRWKNGLAYEAMQFYRSLYKFESLAKQLKLTPEERKAFRLEKSKPICDEFKTWLDSNYPQLLPQSPLGKAFEYCIKYWKGLTHFLTDGRLEIDNNLTEQEIKPIVIARKNFMFANSVSGAQALALHFSLIRTALVHHLDPYQYLVLVFKKIPHCQSVSDYEQLLPWNVSL